MSLLRQKRWNPYLVGIGLGILSWIVFGVMHKALGTSTTIAVAPGAATAAFAPDYVQNQAYWAKYLNPAKGKVFFNWQFFLVLALPVGAWISTLLSGDHFKETVPALWKQRFGPSLIKRSIGAFLGGFLLLFGARMAGGCTSGHGISGSMQLAISSWSFFIAMFASGVVTAFILFGVKGRKNA
ncbi:MAG: YeeE/YedE thiosulfate transporter family protein [Algisphaera sp.]